jgi:IgA Peptidase M64
MSTADGSVGAHVKIVNNGPGNRRWDLVIVGDGYRAGQLRRFHDDVEAFHSQVLKTTPPFDELWPAINVHRVDVTSTDSGADDPRTCRDDPPGKHGSGAKRRTFFDATFCTSGIRRLLTVNEALAKRVARASVPLRNQTLVLVNTRKYGGSGGSVAVSSKGYADQIALHELGHSAFGLADEYEANGPAEGTAEPKEPNVTRNTDRATNKWRDLVEATTPMPTSCNDGCPDCPPPAVRPPPDAVGTYEGAQYQRCGLYRPFPDCYMRGNYVFCPVCARVIRETLQPFLP